MRPDEVCQNGFVVSDIKLMDNIICDTIRLKYRAICLDDKSLYDTIPQDVQQFFASAAKYYGKYKMYHRSNTDGYFAIRKPEGVYITATKTPKDEYLDFNRISLIISYDRHQNTIEYIGRYLPSSDAVEAFVVFANNPSLQHIIHTHDSQNFTRNCKNNRFVQVPPMHYGEPELGDLISATYKKTKASVVILQEHGEMFFGNETRTAFEAIDMALESMDLYY